MPNQIEVCANPLQSDQVKVANGSEMVVANLNESGIYMVKVANESESVKLK